MFFIPQHPLVSPIAANPLINSDKELLSLITQSNISHYFATLFLIFVINFLFHIWWLVFRYMVLYNATTYINQAKQDWKEMLEKYAKKYKTKINEKLVNAIEESLGQFQFNCAFSPSGNNHGIFYLIKETCPSLLKINYIPYCFYSLCNRTNKGVFGTIFSLIYNIGKNMYFFSYLIDISDKQSYTIIDTIRKIFGNYGGIIQTLFITGLSSIIAIYITFQDKDFIYFLTSRKENLIYIENDIVMQESHWERMVFIFRTKYSRPLNRSDLTNVRTSILTNFLFNNLIHLAMYIFGNIKNVAQGEAMFSPKGVFTSSFSSPLLILINNTESIIVMLFDEHIFYSRNLFIVTLTLHQQVFLKNLDLKTAHIHNQNKSYTSLSSNLY